MRSAGANGLILAIIATGCGKKVPPPAPVVAQQGHAELVCEAPTVPGGYGPPVGTEAWCQREVSPTRFIRHGAIIGWYPDGNRRFDGNYLDGKRNGFWTEYFPNGVVQAKGSYLLGAKHGRWDSFHPNGVAASVGDFDAGAEIGRWQFWNAENTWRSVGSFDHGLRSGLWLDYDGAEQAVTERVYERGRLVSVVEK